MQGFTNRQHEFRKDFGNLISRGRESYYQGRPQNERATFDENLKHWCETCDRGFRTETLLHSHVKEHQECKIDGCKFVAHPKVILKHVQMQHSTGLYKKICKLSNPEEIAKWREERKRKYPTKSNIERKKLELEEKIKRGEKLGLPKYKQSKDVFDQSKTKQKKAKRPRNRKKVEQLIEVKSEIVGKDMNKGLVPFLGTHKTIESSDSELETDPVVDLDIEDDICESANNKIEQRQNNSMCNALMNLISTYESSDDENANKSVDISTNDNKTSEKVETKTNCVNVANVEITLDDDSGPEEVMTQKLGPQPISCRSDKEEKKTSPKLENKKEALCKNIQKRRINFRKTPSSLLEKLLHGEIRHERNVTLQCIRFIIDNNYFDGQ